MLMMALSITATFAQDKIQVSGKVTDATGLPVIGAGVVQQGTTNGVITDADGNYSITVPSGSMLEISCIGYDSQVLTADRAVIDILLNESTTTLNEVLVTGYATERKKDIIGSVAVVKVDEMKQMNGTTVSNSLQGLASGVVVSGDGSPDGAKVRIRGFGSFGNSEPLYIIDGMPASSDVFNTLSSGDIESIQVLKDAASASIYGARAASGVIIVTTSRGARNQGKPKVTFNAYTGFDFVAESNFPEMLNAEEFGRYWYIAQKNAGIEHPTSAVYSYDDNGNVIMPEYIKAGSYSGSQLTTLKSTNPQLYNELIDPASYDFKTHQIVKAADTDWFDEQYDPRAMGNIQLGISSRTDHSAYSVSFSYRTQGDPGNKYAYYNRYGVRMNTSYDITKFMTIGENFQFTYSEQNGFFGQRSQSSWSSAYYMQPILPVYDIMGNPTGGAVNGVGQARNPITENWRNRHDITTMNGGFGNVYADVNVWKLVFHTSFGIDIRNMRSKNITQATYENAENTKESTLENDSGIYRNWTWTNTVTYAQEFGKHNVRVILGTEAIKDYYEYMTATREGYDFDDNTNFMVLNTGLGTQTNTGTFSRTMLYSLFGKVEYQYDDKYLFNATVRRDGSSKFGENNRYGVFPSVGIGWRISSEPFMKSTKGWLQDLKLRASYGVIGNQNGLSADNQYSQYTKNSMQGGYAIGGGTTTYPGYYLSRIGDPDAKWEKSITANIGFDATMFKGGLEISAEYFVKKTKDLLVQNQAAWTGSAATQPSINIGEMTNKGVDINLTKRGSFAHDFRYSAILNFTAYHNNVDKVLDSPDSYILGNSASVGTITQTEAGKPISYIITYVTDGFFQNQQEVDEYVAAGYQSPITPAVGKWRLKDLNGDKIINDSDRKMTGSPHPDFQVGGNFNLSYKNWDLGFFIFWSQGGEIFNLGLESTDFMYYNFNRSKRMLYDSFSLEPGADNSDAKLPVIDANDSETANLSLDYYVQSASYIRVKNIQLGYTLPSKITDKWGVGRLRVYAAGQNLFTWKLGKHPFTGLDPEAALMGDDISMGSVRLQSPTPCNVVLGVNLEF